MAPAFAAIAALLLADAAASVERFQGTARSRDGGVAYLETHEVESAGGRIVRAETRYTHPDGRLIARLVSAYPPGSFAPEYEFQDLRTGAREAVKRSGDDLLLQDGERSRVLAPSRDVPQVAGQGLDRYARAHLDALSRGETLRVSLALPGRLDAFGFRLRGERAEGGRLRVHIEPTSLILRILAPSIEAEYDTATGRLVRYLGVSNVAGEDGAPQKVEITYAYPEPQPS